MSCRNVFQSLLPSCLALALGVFVTCLTLLRADHHADSQWEVLFDGSSLNAFRAFQGDSFPSKSWQIENGLLKTVSGADAIDIVTRKQYSNFELVFEWKVSPGGNSGVMYRVNESFDRPWHTGPEYQILDDSRHKDGKNPLTSAGSCYALVSAARKELRPVGQFNVSRIIVNGRRVEHWLNGTKVVALELGSFAVNQLIRQSKFADKVQFAREPSGHLCFQHHHDEVWFRSIKVRTIELDRDPLTLKRLNELTKEQRDLGWRNLYSKKGPVRWRGFLREEFPEKGWVMEEGMLKHLSQGGGGDIVTRQRYEQFDFRFEWKVAPGSNSGVRYFILEEERRKAIGHEYQVIDDGEHPDALRGPKWQAAAFYDCLPASNRILKPVGAFNESRILVHEQEVEHWLNGVMVLSYTLESSEVLAAVARSKFRNVVEFGYRHRGRILLQDHNDEVAYRNLYIKRLDQ